MGFYFKFKDVAGKFRFNLSASNGEIILHSEGYETSTSRDIGIASVQLNSQIDSRYEDRTSSGGLPYFILKGGNYEPIGVSEMYSSNYARTIGKASVKHNGPTTDIRG